MQARIVAVALLSLACTPAALVAQSSAPPPFDSSAEARSAEEAQAAQKAWARFLKRKAVDADSIGMKLVLIPPGRFVMGSPPTEDRGPFTKADAERQHVVTITKPFYMGVYEVTTTEFKQVTGQEAGLQFEGVDDKQFPVTWVTMEQVAEFLQTLGKKEKRKFRLPTEAEWEFACRAGTQTPFWTGEAIDGDQLNCHAIEPYGDGKPGEYLKRPVNVGSFQPNPFGLYDVHGNVAELCSDWYDRNYYANSPERDPPGPEKPKENPEHLARGGGYHARVDMQRSAKRWSAHEDGRADQIGFRVVMELPKSLLAKVPEPAESPGKERATTADAEVASDPTELEGTWKVVGVIENGKKQDDVEKNGGVQMTFEGRKLTMAFGGETQEFSITIDPKQTPKQINLTPNRGPGAGKAHECIYEVEGENLTLSLPERGNRPRDFEGVKGVTVFTLERRTATKGE